MGGDPHPPGMGDPLAVEQRHVGHAGQLPEAFQKDGAFPEGEQAGDVGVLQREGGRHALHRLQVGEREDGYRTMDQVVPFRKRCVGARDQAHLPHQWFKPDSLSKFDLYPYGLGRRDVPPVQLRDLHPSFFIISSTSSAPSA